MQDIGPVLSIDYVNIVKLIANGRPLTGLNNPKRT